MRTLIFWSALWTIAALAAVIFDWPEPMLVICVLSGQIHAAGSFVVKEIRK